MSNTVLKLIRHFYLLIFVAAAAFFYALLFVFDVQTDIQKHVAFTVDMLNGTNFPATFLYFVAVAAFGLFSEEYKTLLFASLIVLSFSVAWKYLITTRIFARQIHSDGGNEEKIQWFSNLAGICLVTAFCIYLPKEFGLTDYFLLGQISPNVWHNSTTIFLMPFALLLFRHSYNLLEKFEARELGLVLALIFLNIAAKPNFLLCFIVVFPLAALLRFKLKREFLLCLIPPFFAGALLILQYVAIYQLGAYGYGKPQESGVTIAPFLSWGLYARNIPVSFLLSAAFPLAYLVFYFKRIAGDAFLYYSYLLFAAGLAILILLAEKGVRETHGNFQWGAYVSLYILFAAVAADFVKNVFQKRAFDFKDKLIAGIFALHVVSGWLYLVKTLVRGNYG